MKYASLLIKWLRQDGYTHCFFVAGGNCMHLLDGVRQEMTCIPFVHEVAAGIAAEYFNETSTEQRAFVLVTAGPGLTNLITAISGAWLESRELLVLGGQVKTNDLVAKGPRQVGIQGIRGTEVVRSISATSVCLLDPINRASFLEMVRKGRSPRKGPVFIEVPLDIQGRPVDPLELELEGCTPNVTFPVPAESQLEEVASLLRSCSRPILLLGGGVSRQAATRHLPALRRFGIPVMTTWNGMDRMGAEESLYFGRPNTWGQRRSNILLQQADLVFALGTRLGVQQTGFNWQQFVPVGSVVQVDVDQTELSKGHPHVDVPICGDADEFLAWLLNNSSPKVDDWLSHCRDVSDHLPLNEVANSRHEGFAQPYEFTLNLSSRCKETDIVIPSSSGGSFTAAMQAFEQKSGQLVVTNKSLAAMGYGLSGAIGAAIAGSGRRTVLMEGDGGFSQNLQELATVRAQNLPIKIFLHSNLGYASIRLLQLSYFDGQYLGCDADTGLGMPDWPLLFKAYGIPSCEVFDSSLDSPELLELFNAPGPAGFIVHVHPEQTYFPKITSRVLPDGGMESNPLHVMDPPLPSEIEGEVFRFLDLPQ
ncbi:MAG: thiamine pyrophosphate-binding protein [Acidimicrobiales bacterium]|jgi:acetolactate synthase-1/2/3 large subunit|nr:thiamine pyrophosphate-binding protein [Acidimicrobiales bacterium]|tara:strand:- start:4552 stop:6324 length:1773 start_codon:yes stop_codon:yes gene_type:complete